jgi:hypothetical protein
MTAVAVFVVRVAMNFIFYGMLMADHFKTLQQAHPGIFRDVIPGFIGTDLIWSVIFSLLYALVGRALGSGIGAGVKLGIFVALLGQALGNLYMYFGTTYMSVGDVAGDSIYAVAAYAIQGAVAAAVYKHPR